MANIHDDNCIFCKIIAGEIPCHKIFEDEHVLAFLDIGPIAKGHALIIPKYHASEITELPSDFSAACGRVLPKISTAIQTVTECPAFNVLQNNGALSGQAVMHVHFHIIPRYTTETGLKYNWTPGQLSSDFALELRDKIIAKLS
ncbi:HIT-like protein [Poriferisphaera corsica]|uniref:HIT-like protein n=1 Tax=Poriferisphaera corsica TaxID=2528020 RepID=A0A517YUN4_9BACT|nr:HIT family protein [Poriferisphaera corsica]QDU33934.1 HIT-like protein [Poriferisphaera corsica]